MGNCVAAEEHVSAGSYPTKEEDVEKGARDVVDFGQIARYSNLHIFTYNELSQATNYFSSNQILGAGGFGLVFKGVIDHNIKPGFDLTRVAVKKLSPDGFQGDKEWLAEVYYLGQLSHPNLVNLIGYCYEDEHRLLVYEYMAYGSLEKHLFTRSSATLPWLNRISIALDAAKGLAFLHGAEKPIIYRDFKASNILLDPDYNGKLSDFGLAKQGPVGEQTHVTTRVMGTHGYAAPEYLMTGHLTARSDVYGFGVLLMELVTGRKVMDLNKPKREQNLVHWARPSLVHNKQLFKVVDPRMSGDYSGKEVEEVARLAYNCTSNNPKARPVMSDVVDILSGVLKNEQDAQMQALRAAAKMLEVSKAKADGSPVKRKAEQCRRRREQGRRISSVPSHQKKDETNVNA